MNSIPPHANHHPGSSYSSALIFRVAARHPGAVAAVMTFLLGEHLGSPDVAQSAAAATRTPVFVMSASDPGEIAAAAKRILSAVLSWVRVQYPAAHGAHGSSTQIAAIASRDPDGAEASWRAVPAFLSPLGPC